MPQPKILISFLGWVGGAERGDHQALRDTWLQDLAPSMDYRFFIGDGSPLPEVESKFIDQGWTEWIRLGRNAGHANNQLRLGATYPSQNYQPKHDEVIVPCLDGYKYLSYKRRESCRWMLKHSFDYMFCCSIDVYARPERLIASDFRKYDYHGMLCGNTGFRGTRSYLPESYIFGGGYWLSAKAAQVIADAPVTYWCEDWWVGIALAPHVRSGSLSRNNFDWKSSPYTFTVSPFNFDKIKYPRADNHIASVELSAGNYDNTRMHRVHGEYCKSLITQELHAVEGGVPAIL